MREDLPVDPHNEHDDRAGDHGAQLAHDAPDGRDREREQRQDQVEGHFCGQAPHLGQPLREQAGSVDLNEEELGDPLSGGCRDVGRHQGEGHDDDQPVGREDSQGPMQQVRGGFRPAGVELGGDGPRAVEQEPREDEEDGHAAVHPCEHRPNRPASSGPGLERGVGAEYRGRCHDAHRVQRRETCERDVPCAGGESGDGHGPITTSACPTCAAPMHITAAGSCNVTFNWSPPPASTT